MKTVITFYFKNGSNETVTYNGSKESVDNIANIIGTSFAENKNAVVQIPSSEQVIHFIRVGEVQNVIFELEDENET